MVKVKVLEAPSWIQFFDIPECEFIASDNIKYAGYVEIKPYFNRDGYYLLNNSIAIIEYGGRAFLGDKNDFLNELKLCSHRLLSFQQTKAIELLIRSRLCPQELEELYYFDDHVKKLKNYEFALKLRSLKNINMRFK